MSLKPTIPASLFSISLVAVLVCVMEIVSVPTEYLERRNALIQMERSLRIGGTGSALSADEKLVDKLLMHEKRKIIAAARRSGSSIPGVENFMKSRAAMEMTTGFKIISKMPKGGVLHSHDASMTSIDWLIKNVTYRPNCYMCVDATLRVKFLFHATPPTSSPECIWRLVSDVRMESGDAESFDRTLHKNLSLETLKPEKAYSNKTSIWDRFGIYFDTMDGLLQYAPVYADYFYQGLREYHEDNVQYVEVRSKMSPLHELDGSVHDESWVLELYKRVIAQFVIDHPDFFDAKIIFNAERSKEPAVIMENIKTAMNLRMQAPNLLIGFDISFDEDRFHPNIDYIEALLYPSKQDPPVRMPYFFHAGETDWLESAADYNLLDAILLNTTRIGHGYALSKHPVLKNMARQRDIALEVNPISNQVLKLVSDLRNHPATALIAEGYPLVISSDDHAVWRAAPLSHDFYVTFMVLTGETAGLSTLKQLALNSFRYSAMTEGEKTTAIQRWEDKWNSFIQDTVREYNLRSEPSALD